MKQKNVGMVQQMVTADWLVLLHTIPWAKRWFALALASKSHFKKSCHGSTGSTHSKGGLAVRGSSAAPQQTPAALGACGKERLEQCRWVFLPRLFADEGNEKSKACLQLEAARLLLCCFPILLRFLS